MPGMIQPERELTWDGDRLTSVKVKSLFSGQWHEMTINEPLGRNDGAITRAQWEAWQGGLNIERAFPQLSAEEREFLMSGATPEEWEAEFGSEDDD